MRSFTNCQGLCFSSDEGGEVSKVCKYLFFCLLFQLRHIWGCLSASSCPVWNILLFRKTLCLSSPIPARPYDDDDVVIGVPPPPHLIKITCSREGTECTKCYAGGSQDHCIALLYTTALHCILRSTVFLFSLSLFLCSVLHRGLQAQYMQVDRSLQCAVLHCVALF